MTDRHRRPFVDVPNAVLRFRLALLAASAAWLACGLVLNVAGAWCVGRRSG